MANVPLKLFTSSDLLLIIQPRQVFWCTEQTSSKMIKSNSWLYTASNNIHLKDGTEEVQVNCTIQEGEKNPTIKKTLSCAIAHAFQENFIFLSKKYLNIYTASQ